MQDDRIGTASRDTPAPGTGVSPNNPCPFLRAAVASGFLDGHVVPVSKLVSTVEAASGEKGVKAKLVGVKTWLVAVVANGLRPPRLLRNWRSGAELDALRERAQTLCQALRAELPDARFVEPEGGYFLWVELPDDIDTVALEPVAARHGVAVVKGSDFLLEGGRHALRLAYSAVTADQVEEGVRRLAAAIEEQRRILAEAYDRSKSARRAVVDSAATRPTSALSGPSIITLVFSSTVTLTWSGIGYNSGCE